MGRTHRGNVWLFRRDLQEDAAGELEALCRSEPTAKDLIRPPLIRKAIRAALQARGPIIREYRGPAFLIPEGTKETGDAVLITKENGHLLEVGFPWIVRYITADVGPVTAAVVNGNAVSICYCARLSSVAAEAGVETLEAARGRGYATTAVSAWAATIRRGGLLPLFSTSWENGASQRVAERLGAVCYGEDWEIG